MRNITLEDFIKRSNEKHNFIYDYSTISSDIELNYKTKVPIICKEHGIFNQNVGDHMNGVNCQACSNKLANEKKQEKFAEEFFRKAREIFGDKYDYSKTEYISSQQYVIITCKIHGDFKMKPYAHITNKSNCPECALLTRGEKKSQGHDEFIRKCREYWGENKYDYSKTNYTTNREQIIVICPKHKNEFIQLAAVHLRGKYGCDQCSEEAKNEKKQEKMNTVFEPLWSHFKNDIEIHIHKDTGFVNGTNLAKSIDKNLPAWTNKHKTKIENIKKDLNFETEVVQSINVFSHVTLLHPYIALLYTRVYGDDFYKEILNWLNEVSKTNPNVREYLEKGAEVDEKLKKDLTELKFYEEEKFEIVIDTSKYKLNINEMIVTARPEDGFINATLLCKAGNKRFNDWCRLDSTKELLSSLNEDQILTTSQTAVKFMDVKEGRYGGSWIHPDLAIQLAQWISPKIAFQVSRWIRELIYTGKDLNKQKTEVELLKLQQAYSNKLIENKKLKQKVCLKQEREKFEPGNYIYIAQSDTTKSNRRYKIGKTKNLEETLACYNRSAPHEYVFYMDCKSQNIINESEKSVHNCLSKFRDHANHEYFILPEEQDIYYFINKIRNYINMTLDTNDNGIVCETTL
jgi:hypothetical protein